MMISKYPLRAAIIVRADNQRKERVMSTVPYLNTAAGILLVIGTIAFWIGAFSPPWRVWMTSGEEYLRIIAQNGKAWRFINSMFVVGVGTTTVGLGVLASILQRTGDH